MAMTYDESALLMTDLTFRGRVRVSCLKYADTIIGEATTTPAHNTRLKWAQSVFQNADAVAMQIQPPTVMDASVQDAGGSTASDDIVQGAVETVVNKQF